MNQLFKWNHIHKWTALKQLATLSTNKISHWDSEVADCPSCNKKLERNFGNSLINDFIEKYPKILEKAVKDSGLSGIQASFLDELLVHITRNRNYTSSRVFLIAYASFEKPENRNQQKLEKVYIMASIIDLYRHFLAFLDDIVDRSEKRNNLPCYHITRGSTAIYDSVFLEQLAQFLLYTYLGNQPYFTRITNLLREVIRKISAGQIMDGVLSKTKKLNLCTRENYQKTVEYKAGYWLFAMSAIALNIVTENPKRTEDLMKINMKFAAYLQREDDYNDRFEDISEGTLSWFLVTALERCNPEQRKVLKEFYGSIKPEHVQIIENLYGELRVIKSYLHESKILREKIEKKLTDFKWPEYKTVFPCIFNLSCAAISNRHNRCTTTNTLACLKYSL